MPDSDQCPKQRMHSQSPFHNSNPETLPDSDLRQNISPSPTRIVIDLTKPPYSPILRPALLRTLTTLCSPENSTKTDDNTFTLSSTTTMDSEPESSDSSTTMEFTPTFRPAEIPRSGLNTARKTVAISEPSVLYHPSLAANPETGDNAWLRRRPSMTSTNESERRFPEIGSSSTTEYLRSGPSTLKRTTTTKRRNSTTPSQTASENGVGSTFKRYVFRIELPHASPHFN